MGKFFTLARPALLAAAALALSTTASASASASAAGTITVDRTIDQQCSYTRNYTSGPPKSLSLPIRLQFTVPESLRGGDLLVIDQRRATLSSLTELEAAIAAWAPEPDMDVGFYGDSEAAGVSITGTAAPIPVAPYLGARWDVRSTGPSEIAAPADGSFGAALPGLDVPTGNVDLTYTGFRADISLSREDYIYSSSLSCAPTSPVVLATVAVSAQPGPPVVEALSDLQSPLTGGATIRLQGRNFTGADSVRFGGTPATSFSVKSDHAIEATVPAHVAASDVPISVSRGGTRSADTDADDFDFVAPPALGSFDVLLHLTCTDIYVTPRTHLVGLRLRGKLPTRVDPGATFAAADLRATLQVDASALTFRYSAPVFASAHLYPIDVALQGATEPTSSLGDGRLQSPVRRVSPGEPAAFEGAFDGKWSVPQPPNTITASAGAGGEVVVAFANAMPDIRGTFGGGRTTYGADMRTCSITPGSGDGVIARIPVGPPPAELGPVVTKVSGAAFAKVGGIVAISGKRLSGAKVTIGGRPAARIATVGSTLYVGAPALPAGVYDVVVTTPKGASPVTSVSRVRYR